MGLTLYNTLGRNLQPFEPVDPPKVGMYVCGPTVQSSPHVGHGRFAVVFDLVRRYLRWRGYQVTYVRNITDVEDKIIAAAAEAGEPWEERARRMTAEFHRAFSALGVEPPDVEPKATEHIDDMIRLIERLIDRGLAYPASNGDVYFSVRKLDDYGKLSGRDPDELLAGARVEISEEKADPLDFALWKAAKPGEPAWESPWGPGRPGWHIECSAMSMRYLGETFDIHGGGVDLIFPHHENEIAQSEGATGKPFARYWLHNGMVNLSGEKMSKSTGHIVDLQAAIDRVGGIAVRLLYLRAHYRSPLEFSSELLDDSAAQLDRVSRFLERAPRPAVDPDEEVIGRFRTHMDDDFGTPEALGVLFDTIREANRILDTGGEAPELAAAVHEMVDVFGLRSGVADLSDLADRLAGMAAEFGVPSEGPPERVLAGLLERRSRARAERDFATADGIRERLAGFGILVEDTADGVRWVRR
jgi:cysteinyl-tRNA synthetase